MSASSVSLVAKQLPVEQQKTIALGLLNQFTTGSLSVAEEAEYVATFVELVQHIPAVKPDLYDEIYRYCETSLQKTDLGTESYNSLLSLCHVFKEQQLEEHLVEYVSRQLKSFASATPRSFNEKMSAFVLGEPAGNAMERDIDLDDATSLLAFTEWLFMHDEDFSSQYLGTSIDDQCLLYLTIEDSAVCHSASKILRWRLASLCQSDTAIEHLWQAIYILFDVGSTQCSSFAYVLWLRFMNHYGSFKLYGWGWYQSLMSQTKYWIPLRDGLNEEVHEHRKFSLVLLQQSVQSLSEDLDLPIMHWETAKKKRYLHSWKRFSTLYEILGIDTAVNQAEAASSDLVKILAPDSDIPVPFGLCILSVGFKAPMERVKNFTLGLAFDLPESSLGLFRHDFSFLTDIFLPFAMTAYHFNVESSTDGHYTCLYGQRLQEFICKCIVSLKGDEVSVAHATGLIIAKICERLDSFGPGRIFVLGGLLVGLEKLNSSAINNKNLDLMYKLLLGTCDGGIWNKTLQTIQLKLLLHLDADNINVGTVFEVIGEHIKHSGYEVYSEYEEFFLDFYNEHYRTDESLEYFRQHGSKLSLYGLVAFTSYLLADNTDPSKLVGTVLQHPKVDLIFEEASKSTLKLQQLLKEPLMVSRLGQVVGAMFAGEKFVLPELYESSVELLGNEELFNFDFWAQMNLSPLFNTLKQEIVELDDFAAQRYAIAQFKFLTNCVPHCKFNESFTISISDIVDLIGHAFSKISRSHLDKSFYKVKDQFYGDSVAIIRELLPLTVQDSPLIDKLLETSDSISTMSEYNGHKSNVLMLTDLLESNELNSNQLHRLLGIVEVIWEDLVKERLVMNWRDLHQDFIKLLLNQKLLVASIDDEHIADGIFAIGTAIIETSYSRRSLMPTFFKCLSLYQVDQRKKFESTLWLSKLLVHGSVLYQNDESIFNMDMALSDIYDKDLNMSGVGLYEQVFGRPEVTYKVYIKAMAASLRERPFAEALWTYIIENDNKFHLLKTVRSTDYKEQWKRLQMSSLMILTVQIIGRDLADLYVLEKLVPRLNTDASPQCRANLEWIIAQYGYQFPDARPLIEQWFEPGIKEQLPKMIATYERIFVLILEQLPAGEESAPLTKFLVEVVLPSATSNRALNRHFSSSMACVLLARIKEKNLKVPAEIMDALEKVKEVADISIVFGKFRTGEALVWDLKEDLTLCGVNGGVLMKISDHKVDAILDSTWQKFLTTSQQDILRIPIGDDHPEQWVKGKRHDGVRLDSYEDKDKETESSLLQTKSGAWGAVLDPDRDGRAAANIKRSPLIVMSSLVDKPVNLGGICRLCDCLGAGCMTVDDLKVREDASFKSVAVTAERWEPMMEVKVDDIVDFMKAKKKEGYTMVGLEQTDNSVELNSDLKFPLKSMIILGKEREGIPANVLAELDMCVIIKQIGVVRSMNIQTATAVIVQAYSAQHC